MGAQPIESVPDAVRTPRMRLTIHTWRLAAVAGFALLVGIVLGRLWGAPAHAGSAARAAREVDWRTEGLDPLVKVRSAGSAARPYAPMREPTHRYLSR